MWDRRLLSLLDIVRDLLIESHVFLLPLYPPLPLLLILNMQGIPHLLFPVSDVRVTQSPPTSPVNPEDESEQEEDYQDEEEGVHQTKSVGRLVRVQTGRTFISHARLC